MSEESQDFDKSFMQAAQDKKKELKERYEDK